MARTIEIEHGLDGVGDGVKRAAGLHTLPFEPVVFNEANDGRLVELGVVDVVVLCPGRDNEQRNTCSVAATAEDWFASGAVERSLAIWQTAIFALLSACGADAGA